MVPITPYLPRVVAADALPTQNDRAYYCAELSLLHVAVLVSQSSYAHDTATTGKKRKIQKLLQSLRK